MLHKAVKDFSNIKVIHYNYPFDKECNSYLSFNMHPGACYMSKVALAAEKQGNYWEMGSLLYENKPKKQEAVLKLVEELGLDKEQFIEDMNSQEINIELEKSIKRAVDLDIDATPTMYINGDQYVGVKPYYELKDILIKHGAKRK